MSDDRPFYEVKSLQDMTPQEWESLCDGCGKCCLHKFIEEDEEQKDQDTLHFSSIVCHLLDTKACQCTQYDQRSELVADCVTLSKDHLEQLSFMPPSCSYRRIHEGKGLPHWHPLRNKGKKSKMHQLGMSVRGKTVMETQDNLDRFEDFIVLWPLEDLD